MVLSLFAKGTLPTSLRGPALAGPRAWLGSIELLASSQQRLQSRFMTSLIVFGWNQCGKRPSGRQILKIAGKLGVLGA